MTEEQLIEFLSMELGQEDNETCSHETRGEAFRMMTETWSTISLKDGFSNNHTEAQSLKASTVNGWNRYCHQRHEWTPEGAPDRLGICCGPASGLLVLDIDDGDAFERNAKARNYELSRTLSVRTGRGRHLYYRYPMDGHEYGCARRGGEGFDVRGMGGYVLAPGSLHPETGDMYRVVDASPIAEAPGWLLDLTRKDGTGTEQDAPERTETPLPPANLQKLPEGARKGLSEGFPVGERSEGHMRLLLTLMEQGLSRDAMREILFSCPGGEKMQENGGAYFEREYESALKYYREHHRQKKEPVSMKMLKIMKGFEFFVCNNSEYYAKDYQENGNVKFIGIDSNEFHGLVLSRYLESSQGQHSYHNYREALNMLKYSLPSIATPITKIRRFGQFDKNLVWDLGLSTGECVVISQNGCSIVKNTNVLLERNENINKIDKVNLNEKGLSSCIEFFKILGIDDVTTRHYIMMTLVSYLFDSISTPILFFHGLEGSGKTLLSLAIKSVFDPSIAGTYMTSNIQDLALYLHKSGIAFIDNFSSIRKEFQNNFCLAYSQGLYVKKKNYADTETVTLEMKCPLILTSVDIPSDLNRDFCSCTAFFKVERKKTIKSEIDIKNRLNEIYPGMRGELCNIASVVLRNIDRYSPTGQRRHADFDRLGQAYLEAVGEKAFFYTTIIDEISRRNSLFIIYDDENLFKFTNLVYERKMTAFTMNEMLAMLEISSANASSLSRHVDRNREHLEKCGIYVFKGTKCNNGQVYLAATSDYLNSQEAVALNITIDNLNSNPSMIRNIYLEHRNSSSVNETLNSMLNQ